MELPAQLADLQLARLAPISQLSPYLSELNLAEAVESFARLADSLPSDFAGSLSSVSSPATSEPSSCPNSHCACYFSSSSGSSNSSSSSGASKSRQRNNANAAERYRKKVKGRANCLAEQELRERQRNKKLRRQLERKLEVYKEFVQLLAANTANSDGQLASLAANSIQGVLAEVIGEPEEKFAPDGLQSEDDRCLAEARAQLAGQLARFASISNCSSEPTGCGRQTLHSHQSTTNSSTYLLN